MINFTNSGDPSPLPYLPFLNPVDLAQIVFFLLLLAVVGACSDGDTSPQGGVSELVLAPDGIGRYAIGQPADEVISGVSATIGGADADSSDDKAMVRRMATMGSSTEPSVFDNVDGLSGLSR